MCYTIRVSGKIALSPFPPKQRKKRKKLHRDQSSCELIVVRYLRYQKTLTVILVMITVLTTVRILQYLCLHTIQIKLVLLYRLVETCY